MDQLELASSLCSRLCHDLIGPVGAVGNGVEILAEDDDPEMQKAAVDLLTHSTEQAVRRLKYFRLAFGSSGGADARISLREVQDIVDDYFAGSRVSVNWQIDLAGENSDPPKARLRLMLNLILVVGEAMPRGGEIIVNYVASNHANESLTLEGRGKGCALDQELVAIFQDDMSEITGQAKAAPALLAVELAKSQALFPLTLKAEEDMLRITI